MQFDIIWNGVTPDGKKQYGSLSPRDLDSAKRAEKAQRKKLKRRGYKNVEIKVLKREPQKKTREDYRRLKVSDWTGKTRRVSVGARLSPNWLFKPPSDKKVKSGSRCNLPTAYSILGRSS